MHATQEDKEAAAKRMPRVLAGKDAVFAFPWVVVDRESLQKNTG